MRSYDSEYDPIREAEPGAVEELGGEMSVTPTEPLKYQARYDLFTYRGCVMSSRDYEVYHENGQNKQPLNDAEVLAYTLIEQMTHRETDKDGNKHIVEDFTLASPSDSLEHPYGHVVNSEDLSVGDGVMVGTLKYGSSFIVFGLDRPFDNPDVLYDNSGSDVLHLHVCLGNNDRAMFEKDKELMDEAFMSLHENLFFDRQDIVRQVLEDKTVIDRTEGLTAMEKQDNKEYSLDDWQNIFMGGLRQENDRVVSVIPLRTSHAPYGVCFIKRTFATGLNDRPLEEVCSSVLNNIKNFAKDCMKTGEEKMALDYIETDESLIRDKRVVLRNEYNRNADNMIRRYDSLSKEFPNWDFLNNVEQLKSLFKLEREENAKEMVSICEARDSTPEKAVFSLTGSDRYYFRDSAGNTVFLDATDDRPERVVMKNAKKIEINKEIVPTLYNCIDSTALWRDAVKDTTFKIADGYTVNGQSEGNVDFLKKVWLQSRTDTRIRPVWVRGLESSRGVEMKQDR